MALDLETLVEGIHERFLTVSPFTPARLLTGEPDSIQSPPIVYTMLDRMVPTEIGNLMAWDIRFMCRCCIAWQDRYAAEALARRLALALPQAIEQDDRLGNRISSGRARVDEVLTGFARISDTTFRIVDVYVLVTYKQVHLRYTP